jgi:hypothetical protein
MVPVRYAVRIRWQAAADPGWEVESHHGGFETAEDAALFANGLGDADVAALELGRGEFRLELTDGTVEALPPAAVTVWALESPTAGDGVATDTDFRRVPVEPPQLSKRGLDGGFVPLGYAVLGPGGEPLDVTIAIDGDLGTLNVTVDSPATDGEMPPPPVGDGLLFGVIPRA